MRRLAVLVVLVLLVVWFVVPVARATMLVETTGGGRIHTPSNLPIQSVQFSATDGIRIRGWLVPSGPAAPVVILVPGFKSDRMSMLPYARFLHAGGYAVLLYDSRGTGQSAGHFTVGPREVNDVLGATAFVHRARTFNRRHIGLLGVSLGAGVVLVAAARDARVRATVADSAFVDQAAVMGGLDHLRLGLVSVPLAPLAPFIVDRLAGVDISSFRPISAISRISPHAVFLIHSRHDTNPTTPLSGALQLRRAALRPAALWVAPRGGHAEAFAAQPKAYEQRVLRFFHRYLDR